jgi:hypothetical protein
VKAEDFAFVGKPSWKPTNAQEKKEPLWVSRFQQLEPGEGFTIYERRSLLQIQDYAEKSGTPVTVTRYLRGGWWVERA